ncbi:MAG: glutathione S-transferase N-terminal domain-containing protein [Panacagrimonas sp.]
MIASSLRNWRGTASFRPALRQPAMPLELYEFEASPYCRLVREVLTELDLDAVIHPCPQGGTRFRPRVIELGGKAQFPFLVDPDTDARLYESADIIDYLYSTYADRPPTRRGLRRMMGVGGSYLASTARSLGHIRGLRARPSRAPIQTLELYSFESSPYSRPVREVMSELELPYLLRNFGKARWEDMGPPSVRRTLFPDLPITGRNRLRMRDITGRSQVPYLIDPNTGTAMYESADIIRYLESTYGLAAEEAVTA